MNSDYTIYENAIKRAMFSCKYFASKAHNLMFTSADSFDRHKVAVVSFVNQATVYMSAAYAIYYAHYEIMARSDIEDVFAAFERFSGEALESFSTEHDYAHADMYFDDFEKAFNESPLATPIEM